MNSIDLSPLYRSTIGFDRLASMIDSAMRSEPSGYPPYNIEMIDDNRYAITLAVAGFERKELDINVANNVLSVKGSKDKDSKRTYLHQGIADRTFERKFNLADHVKVTDASLDNGMLTIALVKEIPEAMKPKSITINSGSVALENKSTESDVSEVSKDEQIAA